MSDNEKIHICYHVNVVDIVPEWGTAAFQFQCSTTGAEGCATGDATVEILMPYAVLQSLLAGLPQVVADMKARGADRGIASGSRDN